MTETVQSKYEQLKHLLRHFEKIAVAFSGGVDSSLLLYAAIEVKTIENVMAIHGRSSLNLSEIDITDFYYSTYNTLHTLHVVDLDPLSWPEFINSREKKCYFCKRQTYSTFLNYLKEYDGYVLIDGTNSDDLFTDRPGLAVLNELEIPTPLAEAGLRKKDVRFLARLFGLENHDTPSNSCFATRLFTNNEISLEKIEIVKKIEKKLHNMGYDGVRAKLNKKDVILQLRQQDYVKLSQKHNRIDVVEFCKEMGFSSILLDLQGR